jgi:hypothetical protein
MVTMTRRERLTAIFEGRVPDRPAVKVWGAGTRQDACVHPAFEPVRDRAVELTDLFRGAGSPFDLYCGVDAAKRIETRTEPTADPAWELHITTYHTPEGDLRQVFRASTRRRPGYVMEHPLKEPGDIRRLLSIPYVPYPFDASGYARVDGELADAGLPLFGLDHAMYGLQRLAGSESFALWSLECEPLLLEAMEVFAQRVRQHTGAAIDAGIRGVFGWVGPELCIPPLMSPAAFERYVFALDAPLIELIHAAGGRIWVHCHGRMGPVLERFADMGIDVLNPLEPPPMGDVTMAEAFARVGARMGLEGNIETHDLMTAAPDVLRARIHATLEAGRGRRLILCPSSGYMENVEPTPAEIDNWMLFIEEGVRYAESMRE